MANIAPVGDFIGISAPQLNQYSCVELCCICSTTSTGIVMGDFKVGAA